MRESIIRVHHLAKTFRGGPVTPDLPVHVTSADWFGGRDPAMDAVLAAPVPHT